MACDCCQCVAPAASAPEPPSKTAATTPCREPVDELKFLMANRRYLRKVGCNCWTSPEEAWFNRNRVIIIALSETIGRPQRAVFEFLYTLTLQNFRKALNPSGQGWDQCYVPLAEIDTCDVYSGIFDARGNLRNPSEPEALANLLSVVQTVLNRNSDPDAHGHDSLYGKPQGASAAKARRAADIEMAARRRRDMITLGYTGCKIGHRGPRCDDDVSAKAAGGARGTRSGAHFGVDQEGGKGKDSKGGTDGQGGGRDGGAAGGRGGGNRAGSRGGAKGVGVAGGVAGSKGGEVAGGKGPGAAGGIAGGKGGGAPGGVAGGKGGEVAAGKGAGVAGGKGVEVAGGKGGEVAGGKGGGVAGGQGVGRTGAPGRDIDDVAVAKDTAKAKAKPEAEAAGKAKAEAMKNIIGNVNDSTGLTNDVDGLLDAIKRVSMAGGKAADKTKEAVEDISNTYNAIATKGKKPPVKKPPKPPKPAVPEYVPPPPPPPPPPKGKKLPRRKFYYGEPLPIYMHEPFDPRVSHTWVRRHPHQMRFNQSGRLEEAGIIKRYRRASLERQVQSARARMSVRSIYSKTSLTRLKPQFGDAAASRKLLEQMSKEQFKLNKRMK